MTKVSPQLFVWSFGPDRSTARDRLVFDGSVAIDRQSFRERTCDILWCVCVWVGHTSLVQWAKLLYLCSTLLYICAHIICELVGTAPDIKCVAVWLLVRVKRKYLGFHLAGNIHGKTAKPRRKSYSLHGDHRHKHRPSESTLRPAREMENYGRNFTNTNVQFFYFEWTLLWCFEGV